MYNLQDAYTHITMEEIFSKVTEMELWRYYCPNFKELNKSFLSELYNDTNPSCRIFESNNRLIYKDFGTGASYSILDYIQTKYFSTFKEALNIICNDFQIKPSDIKPILRPKIDILSHPGIKVKSTIDIVTQPFKMADFEYWNQYHIPLILLEEYNVFSAKHVYLTTKDKIIQFDYNRFNPIYAYRFVNEGEYSYKIYKPLEKNKKYRWLFSGGSSKDIEGYDQLNLNGELLILTKSLKDCMVYRLLGYDAISLQGETNKLDYDFVQKLLKRFDKIVINYDNDLEGSKNTLRLNKQYGFSYFYIDKCKDLSDYVKEYGLERAKKMIKSKLK